MPDKSHKAKIQKKKWGISLTDYGLFPKKNDGNRLWNKKNPLFHNLSDWLYTFIPVDCFVRFEITIAMQIGVTTVEQGTLAWKGFRSQTALVVDG